MQYEWNEIYDSFSGSANTLKMMIRQFAINNHLSDIVSEWPTSCVHLYLSELVSDEENK